MSSFWPFKKKKSKPRNGGTVQVQVVNPQPPEKVVVTETRALLINNDWSVPHPEPVYRKGDRVKIGRGEKVWTVVSHDRAQNIVAVELVDSKGRRQIRTVPRGHLLFRAANS